MIGAKTQEFYFNILKKLNIKKGDLIYLSSGLYRLMWVCKKKGEQFDANLFLETLHEIVSNEGTILIPTYNFDFSNKGYYDIRKTKSNVGYLGNVALERDDYTRTRHPMHSFAVWGSRREEICSLDNRNSFSDDSPFAYLLNNNGKEIGIGVDYKEGFTFVHYVEVQAKVPYRLNKQFIGTYVDINGVQSIETYDYAARDSRVKLKLKLDGLTALLESNGAGRRYMIDGINCYEINFSDCYQVLFEDMKNNKCANIFDFSLDREYIFSNKFKPNGKN